jgi:hypothetical protein
MSAITVIAGTCCIVEDRARRFGAIAAKRSRASRFGRQTFSRPRGGAAVASIPQTETAWKMLGGINQAVHFSVIGEAPLLHTA